MEKIGMGPNYCACTIDLVVVLGYKQRIGSP